MRKGVVLLLGLVAATLFILLLGGSSTAGAETYRLPPLYVIEWSFVPEKGFIANAVWSHSGNYLAVVVNHVSGGNAYSEIIVMDKDGGIVWGTRLKPLNPRRVAWSSDDRRIAALTLTTRTLIVIDFVEKKARELPFRGVYSFSWSPTSPDLLALGLGNRVVVVKASGEKVWDKRIPGGAAVYGVSWSPRGDLLAANTGNAVFVLDARGNMVSRYGAGRERVAVMKWSPQGGLIAVKQSYAGSKVVVIDAATGKPEWSTGRGTVYGYEWGPSGKTLLVAGINLTLYEGSTGKMLWSIKWVKKIGFIAPYQAVWSPSGDRIIVVKNDELIIVDPKSGGIEWRDELGLSPSPRLLGVSKTGKILLIQENRRGRILVLGPAKEYSSILVKNCQKALACLLVVRDPARGVTKRYTGTDNGLLRLYATPGSYELIFRILRLPSQYKAVGVLSVAEEINYTRTLQVKTPREYVVEAPIEKLVKKILDNMAQLVVEAPPGTKLRLRKGLASYEVTVDRPGETIYVPPGTYLVSYSTPGSKVFHLLGKIVLEKNKVRKIVVRGGKTTSAQTTAVTTTPTTTERTRTTSPETGAKQGTTTVTKTTAPTTTHYSTTGKTVTRSHGGGGYTLAVAGAGLIILAIIVVVAMSRR